VAVRLQPRPTHAFCGRGSLVIEAAGSRHRRGQPHDQMGLPGADHQQQLDHSAEHKPRPLVQVPRLGHHQGRHPRLFRSHTALHTLLSATSALQAPEPHRPEPLRTRRLLDQQRPHLAVLAAQRPAHRPLQAVVAPGALRQSPLRLRSGAGGREQVHGQELAAGHAVRDRAGGRVRVRGQGTPVTAVWCESEYGQGNHSPFFLLDIGRGGRLFGGKISRKRSRDI